MLDVILLLLILLLLDDLVFPHSLGVCVKISSVVRQLLFCQPDDVRAHSVQEILQARESGEQPPSASQAKACTVYRSRDSTGCVLDSPGGHAQCSHKQPHSTHLSRQAGVLGALMLVNTVDTC